METIFHVHRKVGLLNWHLKSYDITKKHKQIAFENRWGIIQNKMNHASNLSNNRIVIITMMFMILRTTIIS